MCFVRRAQRSNWNGCLGASLQSNVERNNARCRNFYVSVETVGGMTTMGCPEVYRFKPSARSDVF